ncbi:hypothetical protein Agabi119p4_10001 [Agaricus bisporus var. burnettii]|uniref:Protein kinase domain-containing protein n=1 Tax=Agaricus bisporus var. burnettii TaxID=192524 RepID=A0A8H7EXB8_AGABI|nr:hypothetical protein Agabi119p4_10001 [Agaricus bisporus var. burnettii]
MPFSHAAEIGYDGASLRMDEVLECMSEIIFNKVKRRRLLESRDSHTQPIIDYLNALLLHQNFLELAVPELRKHILIVLQKLCEKSMLYPTCYTLDDIEDISPKGAGGFCDIYQGRYQGQNLCLKVVRLYEKQDQHEMLKAHSREAILWSQLEHPNIAPFYGVFCLKEAHGRICLLSPLMENGNIVEYLAG